MTKPQRIVQVCGKTSDLCSVRLMVDGEEVADHDGYVPDFFPGEHWGDYLMFDIDIDTGKILNWKKPTTKQLAEFIKKCEEGPKQEEVCPKCGHNHNWEFDVCENCGYGELELEDKE